MVKDDFSDAHIPKANWVSFDNVGDKVSGTLIEVSSKEAKGVFAEQIVYKLVRVVINDEEMDPSQEYYVGIKASNSFVHTRLAKAKIGQRIGVKFVSEFDTGRSGQNKAKSLTPYVWDMDPEYATKEGDGF